MATYGVYGGEASRAPQPGDEGRHVGSVEITRADRQEALRVARREFRNTRVLRVYRDWEAERDQK